MKVNTPPRLLTAATLAVCSAGLHAQAPETSAGRGDNQAQTSTINREIALEWMRDSATIASGGESGSRVGANVAPAGDVNNDGLQDMLVAAFSEGENAGPGKVFLVFSGSQNLPENLQLGGESLGSTSGGGRATGASANGAPSSDPTYITLIGEADGDQTGAGLAAAGDINGDGFDDFLIGAPRADGAAGVDTGKVWLIYGGADMDETIHLGALQDGQGTVFEGRFADDRLGAGVAGVGDVNADTHADIALGAYWASPDGHNGQASFPTHTGSVYVLFGDGEGFGASYDLADVRHDGLLIHGAGMGDTFGRALAAAGDVNGDDHPDFLVGARNHDVDGMTDAGAAYLIYGARQLGGVMDLGQGLSGATAFLGEQAGSHLGTSVAGHGDINRDGHWDIVLGAPDYDGQGLSGNGQGRAYIVLGNESTPPSFSVADLGEMVEGSSDPAGRSNNPFRAGGGSASFGAETFSGMALTGEQPGDHLGSSVATGGDANGDHMHDVVIGADGTSNTYLIYGAPTLPGHLLASDIAARGVVFTDENDGSHQLVAMPGDMDGDRYSELVIGNPNALPMRVPNSGAAQIVKGGAHMFQAEGEVVKGSSFQMKMHGTPDTLYVLMASFEKLGQPMVNGKGTWWLGDVYFELMIGRHAANGETLHQVNMPDEPALEGVTIHWQTLEEAQGRHQDLSQPLTTTCN